MENDSKIRNVEIPFDCSSVIKNYKCQTCPSSPGFRTNFLTCLKDHLRDDHGNKNAEEDVYECLKCSFVTCSKYFIVRHSLFRECTPRNEEKKSREEPETPVHEEHPYCSKYGQCPKELTAKSSYKGFKKWYRCSRYIICVYCEQCPYKCKSIAAMKTHMMYRHTRPEDIQWLSCDQCQNKFKTRSSLNVHVRCSHTKPAYIQWFSCDQCRYKSKTKGTLKKHVEAFHTKAEDVRWFECGQCSAKFKRNYHLTGHVVSFHTKPEDIQWFACDQCPTRYKRKAFLRKHITSRHSRT